jgi:NAD(P)-dependent dehydrogenase (short-subunit alcohol dehydrogenase family)
MLNRDRDGARVAVVAGAAQDIGAAIGHELVQRGFRVVLGDIAERRGSLLEAGTVRVALDDHVGERPPFIDREAERGGRAATAPRSQGRYGPLVPNSAFHFVRK